MKFTETTLLGAFVVELEPHLDERGFFARAFSAREFREQGLEADLTEISISRNLKAGTLRGMHFQREPHGETKLVRVVRGRIFDVIVDIRKDSPARGKWFGLKLDAEDGKALYVPKGFAHGFLTLESETDVLYQISDTYRASTGDGFIWDDQEVGIAWPVEPAVLSPTDLARHSFREAIL